MESSPPPELPEPETEFDEGVLDHIREFGWSCVSITDRAHPEHAAANAALGPHPVYDAGFVYTVGLWLTWQHPELILVGAWTNAHAVLSAAVRLVESGTAFSAGDESNEVLGTYPVRLGAVNDERALELLTFAHWANRRRPFDALQLVLPDKAVRWPGEAGYDSYPQPLLA
jgi:hypothetical protein